MDVNINFTSQLLLRGVTADADDEMYNIVNILVKVLNNVLLHIVSLVKIYLRVQ